ncbi:hypothetical protein HS088_TW02G00378 [Tripterygium wilfordii]|uniref:Small ribosomal subunit protein bS18c n=1 Tax=Tripterygium wilfordii TaxID=458696 RepID=A0A7J7DYC1_TRIWF|nr:uncharacterized protein LOC120013259 [Tripterygium wilfordii]KAF5751365.1 hypothetical protein HS088_TW02G00378 [Tripterygium wilfordii]
MITARVALRSIGDGFARRYWGPHIAKTLSTSAYSGNGVEDRKSNDSFESANEFEQRIFGGVSGGSSSSDSFFEKLDKLEKARYRYDSKSDGEHSSSLLDGLDDSFDTLSDGMDGKLKKAATYFEFDPEEIEKEDYVYRPDVTFLRGMTYDTKDLDLTKPGIRKQLKKYEFEVTTEEVLRKADFRNVRFLANFITEAGVIIKRSKTRISAKAQRKVAREIKTARAFGLMPFTTMGTKSFIFGKTMENRDEDYEYESYDSPATADLDGNADF